MGMKTVQHNYLYHRSLPGVRLFCFPYAGGGASVYTSWRRVLGPEIEVVPVQLPGRESRFVEAPVKDIATLLLDIDWQRSTYNDAKPWALFGHSMGALIAFEVARYCRHKALPAPVHLFVSGCTAPQLPREDPPLQHVSDKEFITQVSQRYDGIPREVLEHEELLELVLPALRADMELVESYRYTEEEPLTCPVTAFGGLQDRSVSHEDLLAWKRQTEGPFVARMFPGGHFFLRESAASLLATIKKDLLQSLSTKMD